MVDLEKKRLLSTVSATSAPLVVVGQLASLGSNALKEIVDERVHDGHCLGGHTSVGMHLLQHLI